MRKIFSIFIIFVIFVFPTKVFGYSDVASDYSYKTAIDYITDKGIVQGYTDGTFKPNAKINRAEFTKIVVGAGLSYDPSKDPSGFDIYSYAGLNFSDLEPKAWYIPYLRKAVENNIISGYMDRTFKPGSEINLVEASKILVKTFNVPTIEPKGNEWYSEYIETMADLKYIPPSFGYLAQPVTRGEMAEMIWRILENKSDQESVTISELNNPCYPLGEDVPSNIDIARVRSTWLGWYNGVRAKAGLTAYKYNEQLNRSAIAWSEQSKIKGYMDHKRNPGDSYYDYYKIAAWFKDLGLEFRNVYRVTFTENIGWGPYKCSKTDCTDDLISAIRYTFDFYMAEKDKSYKPHYESVMNKYFNEIGLGIAIDEKAGKYYLTVHYGTEITSNPWSICE